MVSKKIILKVENKLVNEIPNLFHIRLKTDDFISNFNIQPSWLELRNFSFEVFYALVRALGFHEIATKHISNNEKNHFLFASYYYVRVAVNDIYSYRERIAQFYNDLFAQKLICNDNDLLVNKKDEIEKINMETNLKEFILKMIENKIYSQNKPSYNKISYFKVKKIINKLENTDISFSQQNLEELKLIYNSFSGENIKDLFRFRNDNVHLETVGIDSLGVGSRLNLLIIDNVKEEYGFGLRTKNYKFEEISTLAVNVWKKFIENTERLAELPIFKEYLEIKEKIHIEELRILSTLDYNNVL